MFNELLKNVMNLGIITEDDVKRLTAIELMMLIIERTNGLLNHVEIIDEKLVNLLETIRTTTIEVLNKWTQDGTFDTLINQTALKTVNDRIDETNAQLSVVDMKVGNIVSVTMFGAKGDGVTDDTLSIQNAINYAFDNNKKLYIPRGVYIVSSPIVIYGKSDYNADSATFIYGDGRDVTIIKKNNNKKIGNGLNDYVDTVILITNDYVKDGNVIDSQYSSQTQARKIYIDNISIVGNNCEYGIYSLGLYYSKFFNIGIDGVINGMSTKIYNCYNTYERIECNRVENAFNFLTNIGGNSTMNFKDIHLNGVNGYGFMIRGGAYFENVAVDGGNLTVFKLTRGVVEINRCHFEGYTSNILTCDNCDVTFVACAIEMPMVANKIAFKGSDKSNVHIIDGNIMRANRGTTTPPTSPAKLYEFDKTSRIIFDNVTIAVEFDIDTHIINQNKFVVFNKFKKDTNRTYIAYVSSNINAEQYAKLNQTYDENGFLSLEHDGNSGSCATQFGDTINFDNYSRLYCKVDMDFNGMNNGDNSFKFSLRVQKNRYDDGYVSKGVDVDFVRECGEFYDKENAEFYIDISDLYGNYYVEAYLSGLQRATIKEISLLR